MSYTSVFGGGAIYPSDVSYKALTLTADTSLEWPTESAADLDQIADIMDVSASTASLSVILPSALLVSPGQSILFANRGAQTFFVKDADGGTIATIAVGTIWMIYLATNTTAAGTWRSGQFGATTSSAQASTLAGSGLISSGGLLMQAVPVASKNSAYTLGETDRAKAIVWTGGGGTLTLPGASTLGSGWFIHIKNAGDGVVAVSSPSSDIDGAASVDIDLNEGCVIITDGLEYYTLARSSSSSTSSFDYTAISIAGTGTYTLSAAEQGKIAYKFTGLLTGNRTVVVPNSAQQYWVDNSTTGAYSLTVKTAAGTGPTVAQGERAILYCDGTNVVDAVTGGIATPISVANGGTGATTASGARTNLGATSVGEGVFTAASATAARATLDTPSTATALSDSVAYGLVMS